MSARTSDLGIVSTPAGSMAGVLDRMAAIEFQGRLDSARAASDRSKADFLKKIRSLHQKKLELAEAEAEYKSSR